jgi:predicted dehydrogenase
MRLALLGSDEHTVLLAVAAEQSGQHDIVWAGDVGDDAEDLRGLSTSIIISDDWMNLLEQQNVDAVFVAATADDDKLAERLRVLAQSDIALLVSHPASDSPLFYHELDMIRQDTGACIVPLVADRWHPYIAQLAEQLQAGHSLAKIEQVTLERTLPDRSKSQVMRQYMQDVCVLRAVCGELDRVSALPAADPEASFANLGVQMSGAAKYPIRWSVGPAIDPSSGCLTISTDQGPVRIEFADEATQWKVTGSGDFLPNVTCDEPLAPYLAALDMLEEATAGKEATADKIAKCDWSEACRSVELADAVEQSLRRGRAIQLHGETYTEAGVFKGLMGMAGCGLVLLAMVVAVLGTTVGALLKRIGFERAATVVGCWPYALLVIFGVFLLLQLLRLVVPVADRDERKSDSDGKQDYV